VDSFEIKYGFDPNTPNFGDYDGDSLSDFFELLIGSNPVMKDTDLDSFSDYDEILNFKNYNNPKIGLPRAYSITSGNWDAPGTWSCNCIPSEFTDVKVLAPHKITVDSGTSGKARNFE